MRWPMWAWFLIIAACVVLIMISCRTIWRAYQAKWPWLVLTLNVVPRELIKGR